MLILRVAIIGQSTVTAARVIAAIVKQSLH